MKLHYYRDGTGNFGDELNPWLWGRLLPGMMDGQDDILFVGIGTILNETIPAGPRKLIFGAGVGYGRLPVVDEKWQFYCVRGPRTAERLGLPPEMAVTDPAALVARVVRPASARRGIGFMPHHVSAQRFDWQPLCRRLGLAYIDPGWPVDRTLAAISGVECMLADAMHAAIVADALRVPWIPIRLYGHINEFKWMDWCDSLQIDYRPVDVESVVDNSSQQPWRRLTGYVRRVWRTGSPIRIGKAEPVVPSPAEAVDRVADQLSAIRHDHAQASLSSDSVFADRLAELRRRLDRVSTDWASPKRIP